MGVQSELPHCTHHMLQSDQQQNHPEHRLSYGLSLAMRKTPWYHETRLP